MISIHPDFDGIESIKWRLAYEGGRPFVTRYLEQFSLRETDAEFQKRRDVSYCPRFAGSCIDEIKNSIYQRIVDVTRLGGTESYRESIQGHKGGVDLNGNSMNSFIGCVVLAELLVMGRVGVYVDMPPAPTLMTQDIRPYLYSYKYEDICNWVRDPSDPLRYQSVLLRDYTYSYDDKGFPTATLERYRHLWLENGKVHCTLYNASYEAEITTILDLPKIPFIIIDLSESLMKNIADYQIALLNLASSDLYYALKGNFPFYTEQFDPASLGSPYLRTEITEQEDVGREVRVGTSTGRAYPKGTDRPQFIAPPSDPLKASMAKQEQLKEEIRLLLNLAIANLRPQRESAESKRVDNQSLESGLSYIGLTLETAERAIAETWGLYEKYTENVTIKYPKEYSLKTDQERRDEARELDELRLKIPSVTYQKEISKIMANILLSHKVGRLAIEAIEDEIDTAPCVTGDPKSIREDVEAGILDIELASQLRLYPPGTATKAKIDHAERLSRIKIAQSGARGTDTDMQSGRIEKELSRDNTTDSNISDNVRGEQDNG